MARYLETKERGYFRDNNTGAVVNLNDDAYQAYRAHRDKAIKAASLEERVNTMSKDMDDIKSMLGQVLTALQGKA